MILQNLTKIYLVSRKLLKLFVVYNETLKWFRIRFKSPNHFFLYQRFSMVKFLYQCIDRKIYLELISNVLCSFAIVFSVSELELAIRSRVSISRRNGTLFYFDITINQSLEKQVLYTNCTQVKSFKSFVRPCRVYDHFYETILNVFWVEQICMKL